jgi:hypothetical protein
VTSIGRRISEQRESLILAQAVPYMEEGERVLEWVRSRRVAGRGEGFVFLTSERVAIHWTGRNQEPSSFRWVDITAWGIVPEARGGPILGIETDNGTCTVQLRAATRAMADRVALFVEQFAAKVPFAREPMSFDHQGASFAPVRSVQVATEQMTFGEKLKRVGLTVLGATLVIGGILITPLPGPWSFPIVIAGLAVLSQEYDWAKDAREWVRAKSKQVAGKFKARRDSSG